MTCRVEHEWSDYYDRGETLTDVTQCDCGRTTWGQYVEVGALRGVLAARNDEVDTLRVKLKILLDVIVEVGPALAEHKSSDVRAQAAKLWDALQGKTGQTV